VINFGEVTFLRSGVLNVIRPYYNCIGRRMMICVVVLPSFMFYVDLLLVVSVLHVGENSQGRNYLYSRSPLSELSCGYRRII